MSYEEENEESFRFYIFNKTSVYIVCEHEIWARILPLFLLTNFFVDKTNESINKFSVDKCNMYYRLIYPQIVFINK